MTSRNYNPNPADLRPPPLLVMHALIVRFEMRTLALLLFLCSSTFAFPDKDQDIRLFITLQSKVLEIMKEHQPDPFEKGTSNLKNEVQQKIEGLQLEKLSSEQLYRLAVACSVASFPQTAGDQNWDLIFDDVCWRCVRIIATRHGSDNTYYLNRMKALFGADGGSSLMFKELIAKQEKLSSEQDGGGQPTTRPESKSEDGDKPQPEAEGRSR